VHSKTGKGKKMHLPLPLQKIPDSPNTPTPLHGQHHSTTLRQALKHGDTAISALKNVSRADVNNPLAG